MAHILRVQSIGVCAKAHREDTTAVEVYNSENSTHIRKETEKKTERQRKNDRDRVGGWQGEKDIVFLETNLPSSLPCYWPFSSKAEKPAKKPFNALVFGFSLHYKEHIWNLLQPKLRIKQYGTVPHILQGRFYKHVKLSILYLQRQYIFLKQEHVLV